MPKRLSPEKQIDPDWLEADSVIANINFLASQGEWQRIDDMLLTALITDPSKLVILAYARSCWPLRGKLPSYRQFINDSALILAFRGEDYKRILHGLLENA